MSADVVAPQDSAQQTLLAQFRTAVADDLALLSRLHRRELDHATLTQLQEYAFPRSLGFQPGGGKGEEAGEMLRQAMAMLPEAIDQGVLDELAVDFANIYLIYGYRASPCESVWLDEEQLERQQPMFQVRSVYRHHGLSNTDRQLLADDHLSLQLEFIGYLLGDTDDPEKLRAAARFMDEHLLRWLEDFAGRVVTHCMTPFYAGLAALTAVYCDQLRDCLARILDEPRPAAEQIGQSPQPQPAVRETPLRYMPGIAPSW